MFCDARPVTPSGTAPEENVGRNLFRLPRPRRLQPHRHAMAHPRRAAYDLRPFQPSTHH